jgi:hypothetical protein
MYMTLMTWDIEQKISWNNEGKEKSIHPTIQQA